MSEYINAWPLIISAAKLNQIDELNRDYKFFYRSTKFCKSIDFIPIIGIEWCFLRKYSDYRKANYETCIIVSGNKNEWTIPWFIWDDKYGKYSLVAKKIDCIWDESLSNCFKSSKKKESQCHRRLHNLNMKSAKNKKKILYTF